MARKVAETLSGVFPVNRVNLLDASQANNAPRCGAVICVNHSTIKNFAQFQRTFTIAIEKSVFVMPSFSVEYATRLSTLGIEHYFVAPVDPDTLFSAVSVMRNRAIEAAWQDRAPTSRDALVASRATFKKAFRDVRNGGAVDLLEVRNACALVAEAAGSESLENWLAAIRNHHDYTYRHCMFVCGSIVHFAEQVGVKGEDLNLLSMGGLLHDIGKAWIPLDILDKPGKLDGPETVKMREHPSHSRTIMDGMEGLDRRIAGMAVHHHEKLDGGGYPDGLKGAQIDDLVRLTTIADIFSALIDERAYKPSMSYEDAFAKMESMKGHLDLEMLARFKEFAMDARPVAA